MSNETSTKRNMRSREDRIAAIDKSIAFHEEAIKKLKEKKEKILNPKKRVSPKQQMKALLAQAQEAGLTIEEIVEKLGLQKEN